MNSKCSCVAIRTTPGASENFRLALGQLELATQAYRRMAPNRQPIMLGNVALARADQRGIVRALASDNGRDLAAVSLLVRAGDLAAAERMLPRVVPFVPEAHAKWAADEIAQARGIRVRIEEARRNGVPWTRVMNGVRAFMYSETLARALHAQGDTAGAITVLEQTSRLRETLYRTGYFWMRNQKLLAELYRQEGRTDDARSIERDLLSALGAADDDHPMLGELRGKARLAFHPRDLVLITRFENRTGEPVFDGAIEYALEREFTNSDVVGLVSADRVSDALRLMKKPPWATEQLERSTGARPGSRRRRSGFRLGMDLGWCLYHTKASDSDIRAAVSRAVALRESVADWERHWILGSSNALGAT